ncbi:MAG: hypothetical protein K5860_10570 [Bacteroidales bacterium]|nr:hypothetical protein [Bacteroidales bacterium]
MELIKFRRQYLITFNEVAELDGWQKETFNGMNVYAEQSLQLHKRNIEDREFLLVGYWINPHSPEKNNSDIMGDMVAECYTIESVLQFLYPLSGRFALFYKIGNKAYGVCDAGSFRPIYYTDNCEELNITSNIFLLRYVMDLKEKKEKHQFEHSNFYKWSPTFGWCPGYTFYQNVESVIANHYLDINERKICRFFPNTVLRTIDSEADVYNCISRIAELLRNSIAGIVGRGAVSFSLTSGYDSRLILSTAKEFVGKMYFWISYNSKKERDYYLPQKILSENNLSFHPIKNRLHISRKQSRFYFENTPMAHEIWCKYYMSMEDSYPNDFIEIRGSASGTIKRAYYSNISHPRQVTMSFLSKNSNFSFLSECQFLREYMDCYIDLLQVNCEKYGYKTLDLLQWESGEGGQWQAQSQLESDFLHDVFVPLSNREIIDLFLQLPDEYRDSKNMKAYKMTIKIGWPELLNYPFNPPSKYSKFELKMQYYKMAAKFKLKKFLENIKVICEK